MRHRTFTAFLALASALGSASHAQAPEKTLASPFVRVTLQLDSSSTARFDARGFELRVSPSTPGSPSAEIQLVKPAGAHTGDLVRLSASGKRAPAAEIEILDSLGVAATTVRLRDVAVVSDHVVLSTSRVALAGTSQERSLCQQHRHRRRSRDPQTTTVFAVKLPSEFGSPTNVTASPTFKSEGEAEPAGAFTVV